MLHALCCIWMLIDFSESVWFEGGLPSLQSLHSLEMTSCCMHIDVPPQGPGYSCDSKCGQRLNEITLDPAATHRNINSCDVCDLHYAPTLRNVYSSLLNGKLEAGGFAPAVQQLGNQLVDATIELHRSVMQGFLPSAVKFHYQFNLRELSNITQVRPLKRSLGFAYLTEQT